MKTRQEEKGIQGPYMHQAKTVHEALRVTNEEYEKSIEEHNKIAKKAPLAKKSEEIEFCLNLLGLEHNTKNKLRMNAILIAKKQETIRNLKRFALLKELKEVLEE